MSRYMLDSNVLIDLAREPDGMVARKFGTKVRGEIGVSVIVAGEVQYGMRKRPDARSNPSMIYLLDSLRIERMEPAVDRIYGGLRHDLELRGKGISANDYWIVAHAMANDAVLVTSDRAIHEAIVSGLKLEDWRDESAIQEQD